MKTIFNLMICSIAVLGLVSGALAQPQSTDQNRLFEKNQIIGKKVVAKDGKDFGRITELLYDGTGRIVVAVVHGGGFLGWGSKKIAVPFPALSLKGDQYEANLSLAELDNAPTYSGDWLKNSEIAVKDYRYFGIQPLWGSRGENCTSAGPEAGAGGSGALAPEPATSEPKSP